MTNAFSKLRFTEFAKAAAAGTIAGAIALQPMGAEANTGAVSIRSGNAIWFVNTNITFTTTSSGSLAISEAALHTAGASTPASFNRNDAFDGALGWHVYTSPPGEADRSGGYYQAGGAVSVTANTVVGPTKALAGLNAHAELFFPSSKTVARSILYLQNPSGAPITVTVDNDNNLGSDAATSIQATSSGDTTFDAADNWVVSCQQSIVSPGTCDTTLDPVLTFAFQGPGAIRAGSAGPIFASGNDQPNFRFSGITVPAGGTRAVMIFVQLSDTAAHAEADAPRFTNNATLQGTDYLTGLSTPQQQEIVNWTLGSTSVPTLGDWALIALGGLLGLFGLERAGVFVRRRRAGFNDLT